MPLTVPTHPTITPDAGTLVPGQAATFRPLLNSYVGTVEAKAQIIQGELEGFHAYACQGAISGGTIAIGSGLAVSVTAAEGICGGYVISPAGTAGGLAANATNIIYMRQDGTWSGGTAAPGTADGHGTSVPWGSAVTNGTAVTSVNNTRPYVPLQYGGAAVALPTTAGGTANPAITQYARPLVRFTGTAVGTVFVNYPAIAHVPWAFYNAGTPTVGIRAGNGTVFIGPSKGAIVTYDGTNPQAIADGSDRWEDLQAPITSVKLGGVKDPGFAAVQGSVYAYWFDKDAIEEVYVSFQMPHAWREATPIIPHVHWIPKATAAGTARWGFEYNWTNIGGSVGATGTVYAGTPIQTLAGGTAVINTHYVNSFGTIDATGKTISSVLLGRLFRHATDGGDSYGNDAGLIGFDLHYLRDAQGSRDETTK